MALKKYLLLAITCIAISEYESDASAPNKAILFFESMTASIVRKFDKELVSEKDKLTVLN